MTNLSTGPLEHSGRGHYSASGPLYPLGRLGTVPSVYEPFMAYNISLEKKNPKIRRNSKFEFKIFI
jgi:hypothetical protein